MPENYEAMNPCSVPICDSEGKGKTSTQQVPHAVFNVSYLGCLNGECKAPNTCACEIGWDGFHCDVCIPLPGCQNGFCNGTALECICNSGWSGAFCDIRKSK